MARRPFVSQATSLYLVGGGVDGLELVSALHRAGFTAPLAASRVHKKVHRWDTAHMKYVATLGAPCRAEWFC